MIVTWVLQTDIFEENLEKLKAEISRQHHNYTMVKYIPFKDDYDLDLPKISGPVVFYGSLNLASKARKCRNWSGLWCDLKKFECTSYYPYYGKFLFNSEYIMLPWGEIDRRRSSIWSRFGSYSGTKRKCGEVFVRPNSGFKPFCGGLLDREQTLKDFLGNYVVFPEELAIISSKQYLENEYRLVVCDREIVAASKYHEKGKLSTEEGCPSEVIKYAKKIIKLYQPERCFVMDITGPLSPKLVEINSFSCSGFYDCNIAKIVEGASKAAIEEYMDSMFMEQYSNV